MCKMEWTQKEKSLLESKLQESVTAKSELNTKLERIETAFSNQRDSVFGTCLIAICLNLKKD